MSLPALAQTGHGSEGIAVVVAVTGADSVAEIVLVSEES